jgi:cyclic pyranopterin phosphate synthase
MVDVGSKSPTLRQAVAEGLLSMSPEAFEAARGGRLPKGDLLAVARVAGILGAKATPHLVPLCHPVALTAVEVDFEWMEGDRALRVLSRASARDVTGVEMEALAACAAACLALYDMVKSADRRAEIGPIRLLEKRGGKSGHFRRISHVHASA